MVSVEGLYLIVFQSTFTGFVKAWVNGNSNYKYYSEDDFLDLFKAAKADWQLSAKVRDCLCTTGIYIWDVANASIERLKHDSSDESNYILQKPTLKSIGFK